MRCAVMGAPRDAASLKAEIVAMRERLKARGMLLHTPKRHGHMHLERYW